MAIRCARGTKDILAADVPSWHFLENVALDLCQWYGYKEIRTPIFEESALFLQGLGSASGLVEKELWSFKDRNGRALALRGDLTAPVMRAVREHELDGCSDAPLKLASLGPVFLSGRGYDAEGRQIHQFGVEAIGSADPALDAEIIILLCDYLTALGLDPHDILVELNTQGCKECNAQYKTDLSEFLGGHQSELCSTCRRRYKDHPLWTLGCDDPDCLKLSQVVPTVYGILCHGCREHFETVRTYLDEMHVNYTLNPLVVLDRDCYNGTLFAISYRGERVAFGGRYDDMSQMLGGSSLPAVGGAVDLEPLVDILTSEGINDVPEQQPAVCFAGETPEAVAVLLPVMYAMRRAGVLCDLAYAQDDLPALEVAFNTNARYAILLKDSDVHERVVDFYVREQNTVREMSLDSALAFIERTFGVSCLSDKVKPVEVRRMSILHRTPSRTRSRVLYGCDIPRLQRTSRRTGEERGEDRRRLRHRALLAGERVASLSRRASAVKMRELEASERGGVGESRLRRSKSKEAVRERSERSRQEGRRRELEPESEAYAQDYADDYAESYSAPARREEAVPEIREERGAERPERYRSGKGERSSCSQPAEEEQYAGRVENSQDSVRAERADNTPSEKPCRRHRRQMERENSVEMEPVAPSLSESLIYSEPMLSDLTIVEAIKMAMAESERLGLQWGSNHNWCHDEDLPADSAYRQEKEREVLQENTAASVVEESEDASVLSTGEGDEQSAELAVESVPQPVEVPGEEVVADDVDESRSQDEEPAELAEPVADEVVEEDEDPDPVVDIEDGSDRPARLPLSVRAGLELPKPKGRRSGAMRNTYDMCLVNERRNNARLSRQSRKARGKAAGMAYLGYEGDDDAQDEIRDDIPEQVVRSHRLRHPEEQDDPEEEASRQRRHVSVSTGDDYENDYAEYDDDAWEQPDSAPKAPVRRHRRKSVKSVRNT